MGDDDIDLESNKLGDDLRNALGFALSPAVLDGDGAPLYPTKFAQPLRERGDPWTLGGGRTPAHKSDHPQRRLRVRRQRPCCRHTTAEKHDELAALHRR